LDEEAVNEAGKDIYNHIGKAIDPTLLEIKQKI
jgi:hypothetical protein